MMTFSAWLIRKAASSALPGFHGRCSFAPPPAPPESSAPKPPAITLMKLRRSEEHTSELQSLMRISYAVFCLKKKNNEHLQEQTIEHIYTITHDNMHKDVTNKH